MTKSDGNAGGSIDRRSFLQAIGVAAGVAGLGAGADVAAAADADTGGFRNWRAIEAGHVWDRGYRGQADRVIGLTDSGQDARHPALGPWNGVTAFPDGDTLELTKPAENDVSRVESGETESFSGTAGPGTFATGDEISHEFTTPADVDELDASLSWTPNADASNDLEFRIDHWTGEQWQTRARTATGSTPETLGGVAVESDSQYRFVVELYVNTSTEYEISGTYFDIEGTIQTYDDSVVFEDVGSTSTADTPKAVGWYDEGSRYGLYDQPRDPNGHGSHCSSIMAGSGRASAIDADAFTDEAPQTALSAVTGATLRYEIDADAGTGVFGAVYGDLTELRLYDPSGTQIDSAGATSDSSAFDVQTVEQPAQTAGAYTLEVAPADGEDASAAYVDRVGYGPFLDPASTAGDRVAGGADGLHTGVAPDESIICMQGLSAPTADLGTYAAQFAETFNMRAVNMSWGYTGGLPLGAAAGTFDRIPATIKDIAQGGILTLAAAGNAATPINGNGSPAIADECVSVVATGPLDGISGYSSGGVGGVDEDETESYMKPDVTAPGGLVDDTIVAAENGVADTPESEQAPIADFTGKAGTSMATPFTTGAAGLLAQAMEEDGGPRLGLPDPVDTIIDDVYRQKQLLLATASESVFTAAGQHRAKAPTYDFGGRDPFEGYGRLNPGAAVDAATEELNGTTSEQVGLNVPFDERAVAGYVDLGVGELDASVAFTGYEGDDADLATAAPHIDLFVYDGGSPAKYGEPNIVDRAAGVGGSASVAASEEKGGGGSTYLVAAKLVDVPGATNGDDVQVNVDLTVDKTPGVRARGRRKAQEEDSLLGTGVLETVEVTVDPDAEVQVRDVVPDGFSVVSDLLSVVTDDETGVTYVDLGTAPAGEETTFTYEVETPTKTLDFATEHTFGPIRIDDGSGFAGVAGTTGTKRVDGN
ncbi:S8 family serine peptidase [Halolamina salifodinae]|uniref:Subtilisin family serine protease n=1 Tax=Halolamina salifodinae TaxID=1202767 RepID=A0A8T4H410_9EURY|nr:S8 family serine peptidase [Halolamina salifodinae]MBP1988365.1 subtilisin family serine protease [Halolamina salifodinae]